MFSFSFRAKLTFNDDEKCAVSMCVLVLHSFPKLCRCWVHKNRIHVNQSFQLKLKSVMFVLVAFFDVRNSAVCRVVCNDRAEMRRRRNCL